MKHFLLISFVIITYNISYAIDESIPQVDSVLETTIEDINKYNFEDFTNAANLQGINKITAKVSSIQLIKENKAKFGNLEIELLKCWKSPPEEEPESKALLKIWEEIPGEKKKQIYFGWMFASSPSLSSLEHPVYDVIVTECNNIRINE